MDIQQNNHVPISSSSRLLKNKRALIFALFAIIVISGIFFILLLASQNSVTNNNSDSNGSNSESLSYVSYLTDSEHTVKETPTNNTPTSFPDIQPATWEEHLEEGQYKPYYSTGNIIEVNSWYYHRDLDQRIEFMVDVPANIKGEILELFTNKSELEQFFSGRIYRITYFKTVDEWSSVNVSIIDDSKTHKPSEGYLNYTSIIFHIQPSGIDYAFECRGNYNELVQQSPNTFIEAEVKPKLINFCNK